MAQIIRMQGYKDWQVGLITTEELLAGKVYAEPPPARKMWEQIIARARSDWSKVTHHVHCCCDKCAPTEEERLERVRLHSLYHESLQTAHSIACCCDKCLDDMERGMKEFEEMLETEKDCSFHCGSFHCGPGCGCRGTCDESLAPSDCEE